MHVARSAQAPQDFWSSITDVGDPFRVFDEIAGGAATWVDGTEADVRYANGFWLLRSADDIRQALHDTGTFSSSTQPADSSIGRPGIPINIDPPASSPRYQRSSCSTNRSARSTNKPGFDSETRCCGSGARPQ